MARLAAIAGCQGAQVMANQEWSQAISFINADLGLGTSPSSLRVVGRSIQSVGEKPSLTDLIVDVSGDRLLPGLINAHDHLQLNGFNPIKYRPLHTNVSEWINDINLSRSRDRELLASQEVPRRARQ